MTDWDHSQLVCYETAAFLLRKSVGWLRARHYHHCCLMSTQAMLECPLPSRPIMQTTTSFIQPEKTTKVWWGLSTWYTSHSNFLLQIFGYHFWLQMYLEESLRIRQYKMPQARESILWGQSVVWAGVQTLKHCLHCTSKLFVQWLLAITLRTGLLRIHWTFKGLMNLTHTISLEVLAALQPLDRWVAHLSFCASL